MVTDCGSSSLAFLLSIALGASSALAADNEPVSLVLDVGTPLRLSLDARLTVRTVGQPVTATVVQDTYAYDRVVVPKGTQALGHVATMDKLSKGVRAQRLLRGDLSPLHRVAIQFDTLVFSDGRRIPIATRPAVGVARVSVAVAKMPEPTTRVGRARKDAERKIADSVHAITKPGRMERLRTMLIDSLPYHREHLPRGTRYAAQLAEPLVFGRVAAADRAPDGAMPPPGATLRARLLNALDSANTPRGSAIHAVLTEPAMSDDGKLILPEGTALDGEVTFTQPARHLHRNGQLRFLFEHVRIGQDEQKPLLASLSATESGQRVAIDEEGGMRATEPITRFVAPAIAAVLAHATLENDPIDAEETADGIAAPGANVLGRAGGGFIGLGVLGVALSQTGKPAAVALGVFGLGRSVYTNLLGKGRNVVMPVDTLIELQLSPTPSHDQTHAASGGK